MQRTDLTKVLITGADGFLGKNLRLHLRERLDVEVRLFTKHDDPSILPALLNDVSVVFHLAGVNRPIDVEEFDRGNAELTQRLVDVVKSQHRSGNEKVKLVFASSTQADLDNPYGRSKRKAEQSLFNPSFASSLEVFVYRLPNVFGKWARPNYNSVVATFCYNLIRDLPIQINDPLAPLTLVYVDDLMEAFINILDNKIASPKLGEYAQITPKYQTTVGSLANQIKTFKNSRSTLVTERVGKGLVRALYATYVSYMPKELFSYRIPRHSDARGDFVEMLKTQDSGQFSFFTALPGVTRGGHYHHSKTEKFLVIKGCARFRFRHMESDETYELMTSGRAPEIVETVPGWTHDITNTGTDELIVMIWANEIFDTLHPDTFKCLV